MALTILFLHSLPKAYALRLHTHIFEGYFECRFAENPLVLHEPHIRFYAGAPLISSTGHRLGSLCVIDRVPRELEAHSCSVLINFAEIVVRELEKEQMWVSIPEPAALNLYCLHIFFKNCTWAHNGAPEEGAYSCIYFYCIYHISDLGGM
jgi:hypothetical protein